VAREPGVHGMGRNKFIDSAVWDVPYEKKSNWLLSGNKHGVASMWWHGREKRTEYMGNRTRAGENGAWPQTLEGQAYHIADLRM